jgi:hypothetical protein
MEVSGQLHTPAALPPRERAPGTHWIGGWVSPRAVLDAVVKRKIPSPCRESNPRIWLVQAVAQRYLRDIAIDVAKWIRLAQDRVQWQAFMYTVMNLHIKGKVKVKLSLCFN